MDYKAKCFPGCEQSPIDYQRFFFREQLSHMKNNMTAIKVFWSMEVNFLLVWEPAIFFFFNYQFRTFLFGTLKHCARKGIVKIVCRALANTTFQ